MFVDEVKMKLIAGKGGDGCTSFRREKYVAMGGPDGGNGGKGADIIFKVDNGLKTLLDLKYKSIIKAPKGNNGEGQRRRGANAESVVIKVPSGTMVYDDDTHELIADLIEEGEEAIIAHGGRGGRGNASFATHDNTAPKESELGEPGETKFIKVDLRLIADVGLVGLPSVGKSTLLGAVTASKPKIAEYHFTTLSPNLGVVKVRDGRTFVLADLPGLIEGASEGVGLGDKFLKHASRTRIIVHVVDMGALEGRNPIEDYELIRKELVKYSSDIADKKEIIVANKMDMPDAKENLELFKKKYPDKEIYEISALTRQGLDNLMTSIANEIDKLPKVEFKSKNDDEEFKIKFEEKPPFTISREDGVWVLKGDEVEKLFKMTRFNEDESVQRFARKLKGMGVDSALERMGAKKGDEVVILDYVFEWR